MAFITGNPFAVNDYSAYTGATPQKDYSAFTGEPPQATLTSTPTPTPTPSATPDTTATQINNTSSSSLTANIPTTNLSAGSSELRAILKPLTWLQSASSNDVFSSAPIMSILTSTNGMLFPYTPTINFSQSVNYTDLQLVHSNTDYPSYTRTPTCSLTVSGKFTVQNQREGQYAMACIHFLRTVSKSYFGEADATAGTAGLPPPVLVFSAYGTYMFNNLRCILKSHSWTCDEQMDTVSVQINGATVRIPAMFTIQCELTVVQTPQRMRNVFSFEKFASGALMSGGGGWV